MADTSRTVTDMASNLFQDSQAAGSITPQDLRDFLETCQTKQGSIYISTAGATTIAGQANVTANSLTNMVAVETGGTFTLSTAPTANEFDMNTDGQLRYTGTPTTNVFFTASVMLEIVTSAVSKETVMAVTKNGTIVTGAKTGGMSPSVTVNSTPMSIAGYASMATNDYLNLWVGNVDSTDNLVARMAQLTAHSLVT
eukprot:GHVL01018409.1.p2 GENE.GHVL01018409.1~~GHVL01018409.1.p2  ORF type:complete len:197 (+),score=28.66 GHVL01018409.1:432-1022(+)